MSNTFDGNSPFIAYQGKEHTVAEIIQAVDEICPKEFACKSVSYDGLGHKTVLAKMVPMYGLGKEEPNKSTIYKNFSYVSCTDRLQTNYIDTYYAAFKEKLFGTYSNSTHFCAVIYDNDELIAGVTIPSGKYLHLYYGYTKERHEIMYSNDKNLLGKFCSEIFELPDNTYIKNNNLYDVDGNFIKSIKKEKSLKKIPIKKEIMNIVDEEPINKEIMNGIEEERIMKEKEPVLIEKNQKNADILLDGLNGLLVQIADATVRERIERDVENYLAQEQTKKKVSDFVFNELDTEMQKQILLIVKNAIEEYDVEHEITEQLTSLFDEKLEEYASKVNIPVVHVIKLNNNVVGQTKGGFYHEKFEQILTQTQLDEPIMLIGPAGSGKNVAISQVADALGLHMYYTNNASNEFKLTGFIDAGGTYRDTEFYKAFKNGGLFFLDEIDNSDPSALIVINSALANGYMAFPHETIDRHPNFRIIAAANTWGKGSDLQYVGRNALDAATLDRFDNIFFDYDQKLEAALYPREEVLNFMWAFREAVYKSRIPHIVSTRGIGKVYKKDINDIPVADILTSNVIKNLGQDDVNTIIGNMKYMDDNKFMKEMKRLKLGR